MVNDLVVEATDLHKEFQRDAFQVIALQDVHLTIQRGEFVAFMRGRCSYLIAAIDRPTRAVSRSWAGISSSSRSGP